MKIKGNEKQITIFTLIIGLIYSCSTPQQKEIDYFGQTLPGNKAVLFAPGIVSLDNRFEQAFCYSPDGTKCYTSITKADWSNFTMFEQTHNTGNWGKADTAEFLPQTANGFTPVFYPNSNTVYFPSIGQNPRNTNILKSSLVNNSWTKPVKCPPPINSSGNDWHVSFSNDSTMYLSTDRAGGKGDIDIYVLENHNGTYPKIKSLGDSVNTAASDCNPIVSPDGSFIIFESEREGSFGGYDLYVTFRTDKTKWSIPINLGKNVNTTDHDMSASTTPDNKNIIFSRRDINYPASYADIYWVSMDLIDSIKVEWKNSLINNKVKR